MRAISRKSKERERLFMYPSPECQALSLGPGRDLAARLISRKAQDPAQPRYHHFHPAAEIVWFRSADAVLHTVGQTCRTGTADLVFVPSMTPHDFDVAQGKTEFALILYDPARERRLPPALQARLTQGPLVVASDDAQRLRIDMLVAWLVAGYSETRHEAAGPWKTGHLLDLVLTIIAEEGRPIAPQPTAKSRPRDPLARLARAIALIHDDPARPLSLTDAAASCHLSPAYFSRLFKSRMGQTFADYLMAHRLNLAAQLVSSSDLAIAEIAWRTGFGSPAHLSSRFSERFGLSPSRYRAAARRSSAASRQGQDGKSLSPA
jgi:AraC-like DNA-binding protein